MSWEGHCSSKGETEAKKDIEEAGGGIGTWKREVEEYGHRRGRWRNKDIEDAGGGEGYRRHRW